MANDRPPVTGAIGTPPPPDAPVEVASGAVAGATGGNLDARTLAAIGIDPANPLLGASPIEMARANERELAPLNPIPVDAPPIVKTPVVAAGAVEAAPLGLHHNSASAGPDAEASAKTAPAAPASAQMDALAWQHQPGRRATRQMPHFVPATPVVAVSDKPNAQPPAAADKVVSARPPVQAAGPAPAQTPVAADEPYRPAASNTDSSSRGIPRAIADPGKQITGGFGAAADAQYFPLAGDEALKVVWVLMDELAQRLQNDLRFSIAVTYPRIAIKAMIVVEAFTEDRPIEITKVAVPHDKTPIEIAQQRGDEVVFVVKTERREMDAAGTPISPANALREEIGSVIPRKQAFGQGPNRIIADIGS